tara:strand:- start:706 stop:1092 length:387 start_codon:yes stop_codon:yes gene_type:complete
MAGSLDTALKSIAKQVVSSLGTDLDTTITYTVKTKSSYRIETGEQYVSSTAYSNLKVPIEFINATEDDGREVREAKLYITPDLIGSNQPTFEDEVTLTYGGGSRVAQIINIDTRRGGQVYLYTLTVRF